MWTDEDIESLYMVADGVLLTTYAGSSIDFRLDSSSVVASIPRTYQNKTVATMFCSAGVFGTLYEYAVTYLGWEEPSMPSVVAIPSLPQSINGAGRTLYLRKGDNSHWTEADIRNLEIKVGNDTCEVVTTETGYDYTLNGTVYCSITGSLVTGSKIPILCHGTSEGQPLNYTITSITRLPVRIIKAQALVDGTWVDINGSYANDVFVVDDEIEGDYSGTIKLIFNQQIELERATAEYQGSLSENIATDDIATGENLFIDFTYSGEPLLPMAGSLEITVFNDNIELFSSNVQFDLTHA